MLHLNGNALDVVLYKVVDRVNVKSATAPDLNQSGPDPLSRSFLDTFSWSRNDPAGTAPTLLLPRCGVMPSFVATVLRQRNGAILTPVPNYYDMFFDS